MRSPSLLLLLAATLTLAACASAPPARQALRPTGSAEIRDTDVWLGIPQSAVFVQLPEKAAKTVDAEALAAPLRETLAGYGFDARLRTALDEGLRQVSRLSAHPTQLQKTADEAAYQQRLAASPASAVLLLTASYSLSPDLANLEIGLRGELMPRSPELRSANGLKPDLPKTYTPAQALYRNTVLFRSRLPIAVADPAANRAQWLVDEGYPLEQALDDGIAEVVAALIEDLRARPGDRHTGPALTDGYRRQRNADGTIAVLGVAGTGRSVQASATAGAPLLFEPTAILPPPEPVAGVITEMVEPGLEVVTGSVFAADTPVAEPLAAPAPPTLPETAPPLPPPAVISTPAISAPAPAGAAPPAPPAAVAAPAPKLTLSPELSSPPPVPSAPPVPPPPPRSAPVIATPAIAAPPSAPPVTPKPPPSPPKPALREDGRSRAAAPLRLRPTPLSSSGSSLATGAAVQLQGRTRNTTGEWLFVITDTDSGWVRAEEIELAR